MSYCVYKHTFPNGKVYIGITSQKPEKRWNKGKGYLYIRNGKFQQPLMARAIQKYDWDNIKHNILFKNLTKEEAEKKEIELINYYKSNQYKFGYNISNGGNCVGTMSEETKRKISKIHKGKTLSNEHKKRIIEFHKGRKRPESFVESIKGEGNPFYGKHHTEETKKKISKSNKGRKPSKETIEKIVKVHKGKKLSEETKRKISESKKGKKRPDLSERNKKNTKPIICIENGIIYNGQSEASRQTSIPKSSIGRCVRGVQATAGGYHWEFV